MATDAYSIGSNWIPSTPGFARFQLLPAAPSTTSNGRSYFDTTSGLLGIYVNGAWTYITGGGGGGSVTSVFGRTGLVTAQSNDYTFAQIGSKPTTLSGYGISDPVVLTSGSYSDPTWVTALAWSKITGTPTTVSAYGITDAVTLTGTQTLTNKTITGYQQTISLTTTGSSGAATLVGNTLNIPQYSGGSAFSTTQYMWVVGGANNFASLPGTPTPPMAGATTLVDSGLTNNKVRVFRNGVAQMGLNPGNGNTYYTKVTATNTLTFSAALAAGEEIIVETTPA